MTSTLFHPAVESWFRRTFAEPTPAQRAAWPAVQAGRDVLVAAPTGSGKTLAAFLATIDDLVRRGADAPLPDETAVVYVSPLKALSNDIHRNLELPLAGIRDELAARGEAAVEIRTLVRTGDTPQSERAGMRKRPPHVVITTPESLYVLLGSESGRAMLATTRTVIVDEIHAIAGTKRGAHLALSLERLERLAQRRLVRIGLSATQKPIEKVARFLMGARRPLEDCVIVDEGHVRARDLQLEVPPAPLEAVMSGEVWQQVYDRLAALIAEHRTTLVFVNTRRHAERVARHLSERLGDDNVTAHHGSLAKERRFDAEQRLKAGRLKALVATASLELGIDIGDVDLVCQLGACRSISTFLQRAGRAGHSVGGTPKARLFPLSRDELAESVALLDAVRRAELDTFGIPDKPLDVLAQQIVAEVAADEWDEDALFELVRGAWPYRDLARGEYDEIVRMLAEGFGTRRGQARQYLHRDAVNKRLRARRGARLTALTSGGTIPDNADYEVVLEPGGGTVGTVNEDFAVESLQGDIFQLGNASYRILRVEAGRVRVEDAHGQPPSIPFWLGEAPGRSDELSQSVSRLRETLVARIGDGTALDWLTREVGIAPAAATQLVDYYAAANKALGALPTLTTIVLERFFDETGGMQLVIHSPYGSRINRAWGLALRKRFCVKFDFELQAAATEDAIVLSLSTSHSFPLADVVRYLHAKTVRDVLVQAMLAAPMFAARWRWDAAIALAIPRFRGGNKVPPQLQRMYAEDLIAQVFPDQIACAENLSGPREIPDHPLVAQVIDDCLHEAMDIDGLERLLAAIDAGTVQVVARDVTEPSPLALEILSARPYAYLDDAPLEERRTQAVMSRRWLDVETASDLGRLDPEAIERVRDEAYPGAETPDELHDALLWFGFLTPAEAAARAGWPELLEALAAARRATRLRVGPGAELWVAAERLPRFAALLGATADRLRIEPPIVVPESLAGESWDRDAALVEIVRGRLEGLGPVTARAIADPLGVPASDVDSALLRLESEGFALRGSFTAEAIGVEWCERRLLARIHRYTVNRLRREIEPVTSQDFMRFLIDWHHAAGSRRKEGPQALEGVIAELEGFEAPAAAWETEILPARLNGYDFGWLDDLSLSGRAVWTRLSRPAPADDGIRRAGPVRTTPIALLPRRNAPSWHRAASRAGARDAAQPVASPRAERARVFLAEHGASFFDEIVDGAGLLPSEVEEALAELVALGYVVSDGFAGLRALLVPVDRRQPLAGGRRRRRTAAFGIRDAGRWSLIRAAAARDDEVAEHVARTLLRRYGVVFWRILAREAEWLPPWRELLRVFRRLEARGEIRGGRFVAGVTGEQYALPEAVAALREVRRRPLDGELVAVSGADPLNLVGIVGPGVRVPALTGNRVLYRDGVAIATRVAGDVQWLVPLDAPAQAAAKRALLVRSDLSPQLAFLR
ncbi:MAG TPA: DEAD/DEAH box helicase [Burkholderiaceae bacterium]|nr:DEAD/DEAH box helicase [Burkholderiaceae bacterium]